MINIAPCREVCWIAHLERSSKTSARVKLAYADSWDDDAAEAARSSGDEEDDEAMVDGEWGEGGDGGDI